jgi:general secretion pathway protein D
VVSSDTSALPTTPQGTAGGTVQSGAGLTGQPGQAQQGQGMAGGGSTLSATSPGQGGAGAPGATGAGFIQADASTNTLIITANEAVYRNLRAVIDMLDVRRAQVYIESLIVEVTANRASEFGVQWAAASGDANSKYRVGGLQSFSSGGNNLLSVATKATAPANGFTIGVFKQIGNQIETDNNANILSTPNMLTLDNELSTIKVGKNVPIISGQFTTPTGGANANPFQTIDRRDVGLTLKVRPQISEGGTIKMAIYHETSSVDPGSLKDPAGVTTNIRVIENNVIADDGQIIVLGGLIEDTAGDTDEKVPGLGDIPVLGNLFKYKTRSRQKTNLMVFLRPVVVRSKDDSNTISNDRYDYMRSSGMQAQPTGPSLVPDLGAPVLPPLSNGQPPTGGVMAPVPPRKPVPVPARPGLAAPPQTMQQQLQQQQQQQQQQQAPVPDYRPVQK